MKKWKELPDFIKNEITYMSDPRRLALIRCQTGASSWKKVRASRVKIFQEKAPVFPKPVLVTRCHMTSLSSQEVLLSPRKNVGACPVVSPGRRGLSKGNF